MIDEREYSAHRLAWLYVHGAWPTGQIDHINGDRGDNRISNLRDVTPALNTQNQRRAARSNKSSGLLGVTANRGRWLAQISIGGKSRNLGRYATPEEAHAVYVAAKRVLHAGCTL